MVLVLSSRCSCVLGALVVPFRCIYRYLDATQDRSIRLKYSLSLVCAWLTSTGTVSELWQREWKRRGNLYLERFIPSIRLEFKRLGSVFRVDTQVILGKGRTTGKMSICCEQNWKVAVNQIFSIFVGRGTGVHRQESRGELVCTFP